MKNARSYQLSASARKVAIIGFAILLFVLIRNWLPLDEAINDHDAASIRTGLAILALAAVLWLTEAMPLALTAILVPVIASLTGVLDVSESFAGFAHPLIFLFLGSFGLAAALSKQGLDRWLAINIVGLGRGNFQVTALALFMVSAALSMWITNTATVALMLPVALGILSNISIHCDKSVAARASTYLLLRYCLLSKYRRYGHPHWHSAQCHRRSSFENGFYPMAAYRLTRCDDFTPRVVHSFTLTYQPG